MKLKGGRNIAMKAPPHQWEKTVAFYRDTVGLEVIKEQASGVESVCFQFGANQLWIDKAPALSQSEVWLELRTDDVKEAGAHLASMNTVRCDAIESLPDDFKGFWIQNPADIVHIVCEEESEE